MLAAKPSPTHICGLVLCDRGHVGRPGQGPVIRAMRYLLRNDRFQVPDNAAVGTLRDVPACMAGKGDDGFGGTGDPGASVITKVKPKTKRPSLYRVLILNDDYTPMEFVVLVLEKFFQKDIEAATKIMLHVHHHGIGECGIFTYEIAETKVTQVMDFARKHQHPLQCVMEKK
jgi:ATP-dependent Clp protease adaptor protein ClpS